MIRNIYGLGFRMPVVGGLGEPFLPPVCVVGGGPPPLWVWLGLGGIKRHDLRSSTPSCECGWVGVSPMEELRNPFLSFYGMGMSANIYMITQDYL